MKKIYLVLLLFVFLFTGCKVALKPEEKKFNVVATIFPLADVASNIGGSFAQVDTLVPPGASPHAYEPRPSDVAKLAKADLVLVVGAGMDDWVVKMANSSGIDSSKIVDMSKFVTLNKSAEDEGKSDDPHYWVSPKRVLEFLDDLEKVMAEKDTKNGERYQRNMDDYKLQLEVLDKELTDKIGAFSSKDIITFHDAFGYLAKDYGLNIAGVIELAPGVEPTPQELQKIEEDIKAMGIKAVFAEPQLSSKVTEGIKNDLGISIGVLDPIGGIEGRMTYVGLTKNNLLELGTFLS